MARKAIQPDPFVNPYGQDKYRPKLDKNSPNRYSGFTNKNWTTNPITGKRTMSGAEYARVYAADNLRANQIIGPTYGQVVKENRRSGNPSKRYVSTGGMTFGPGVKNSPAAKRKGGK